MMHTRSRKKQEKREVKQHDWQPLLRLYRACLRNAAALLAEAKLLLSHRHYARAYVLAFTAYEEIGKSQVVADFFEDVASKKEFDRAFQAHNPKVAYVRRAYLFDPATSNVTVDYDPASARNDFVSRSAALYVGCGDGYEPVEPSVSETVAKKAVERVEHLLDEIFQYECITERVGSKSFTK